MAPNHKSVLVVHIIIPHSESIHQQQIINHAGHTAAETNYAGHIGESAMHVHYGTNINRNFSVPINEVNSGFLIHFHRYVSDIYVSFEIPPTPPSP